MGTYSQFFGRIASWFGRLSCCGFFLVFPALASSAEPVPKAVEVDVGIYLNNIPSVSLKEKKFQADFYIWFRWTGDGFDPLESFELVNGQIDAKDGVIKKKIGNVNYASCRVRATLYRNFDLSKYPLDSQSLKIQVEDTKFRGADMIYRPDKSSMGINSKIEVPGWRIAKTDSYASVTTYPTTRGDISQANNAESKVPRFTFSVNINRGGFATFIKLFAMLFLAAGLSFCAFTIRSDHIDARFACVLAGVFLAAITQSTLSTVLPDSDSFGMADQLYNMSMAFILFVFLISIYTFKVFHRGDESRADRFSHRAGIFLLIAYVLAIVGIVNVA